MPAIALLVGTWLQLQQADLWPRSAYGCLLGAVAAAAVLAWRGGGRRRLAWLCCAAALLGFALPGWRAGPRLADRLDPRWWGRVVALDGVVRDLPETRAGGVRFVFQPRDPPAGVPSRVLVSWHGGRVAPGQVWRLPLLLRPAHGLADPGVGDAELRLFERGIGAAASVATAAPALRLGSSAGSGVARLRQRLRQRIAAALAGRPQAGVVQALAIGDQSAIPAAQWELLRATGVAHLVAISGLHVAMLAAMAASVAARLWRGPRNLVVPAPVFVAWARLGAAAIYAVLSGLGVPAQRALLMLGVATLLRLRGQRPGRGAALAWALAAVLAWDPWALLQPGFWLSFCAVAALVVADPGAASRRRALAAAVRTQLAVSLALAPLTLALFQQIAVVGPLANALAIPTVTLWVAPASIAGLLLPAPLDAWAWGGAATVQQGLSRLLALLAALPLAQWRAAAPGGMSLALAAIGAVALVLPWPWRLRAGGVLLLLPLLLGPGSRPPPGRLEVWIVDVGQGSAVLLRTARHSLLVDAGPAWGAGSDAGERVLLPLLRGLGETRLDLVVLSHGDADHVGGAAAVARAYPGTPALGSVDSGRMLGWGFAAAKPCVAGQRWSWDGVEFAMLHPPRSGARGNAASCVLRVASRRGAVLVTGDIGHAQELALAGSGAALHAELLLAPHHGSRGSSSEAFVRAVAPALVAVQAGYMNRYGHPAAEVELRYARAGAQLARTDRDGALLWRDDRPRRLRAWRAQHRRYWSWRLPDEGKGLGAHVVGGDG